jgi:hypothetical protein
MGPSQPGFGVSKQSLSMQNPVRNDPGRGEVLQVGGLTPDFLDEESRSQRRNRSGIAPDFPNCLYGT